MSEIQNLVSNVVNESETVLNRALDNVYISTAIKIFIALYAGFAAPQLPKSLVDLMDNVFMRIGIAFVIVFFATRDPSIALLVSIAFIVTLQQSNKMRLYDTSLSIADPGESSWLPSVSSEEVNNVQMPGEIVNDTSNTNEISENENQLDNVLDKPIMTDTSVEDQRLARSSMPSETVHDVIENMVPNQENGLASNAAPFIENTEFTTNHQFNSVQNNSVEGSNHDSCLTNNDNQYCSQGLSTNVPSGFGGNSNAEF